MTEWEEAASNGDEAKMAALYAEFAEEDRALAEAGMADYAALAREDVAQGWWGAGQPSPE